MTCIDLTTLSGDDTPANTARLALKAARPVRADLLQVCRLAKTFMVQVKAVKIELYDGCLKNWQKGTRNSTCQYRPGTLAAEKKRMAKRNFPHT